MAKSKGARITITLECSCQNLSINPQNKKGTFRYTTTKNRRNTPNRLEIKKFCPVSNCHKNFKEIK